MSVSDAEVQALETGHGSGNDELDEKWDEVLEFILRAMVHRHHPFNVTSGWAIIVLDELLMP